MSGKYLLARQAFATGSISWTDDEIKACLLGKDYKFNDSHALNEVLRHRATEVVVLDELRAENGSLSCSDVEFKKLTSVPKAMLVYCDGVPIAYLDDISGLPSAKPEQFEVMLVMPKEVFRV